MKKEDLKIGQIVWLHFKTDNCVDQEVTVSRINKKYFYVRDYLGFESMFEMESFEEYNPNHMSTMEIYENKEEYDKFDLTEKRRKELANLLILLDEDEVNFLHKKLEERLEEVI